MSTPLEQLIQGNRDRTRAQILGALHRANARQSKVAQRRVAWRIAGRTAKWLMAATVACAALVVGLQQVGLIPHIELVVGDARPAVVAPPPPTRSVRGPVVSDPGESAETDQQSAYPVELKLTKEISSTPF